MKKIIFLSILLFTVAVHGQNTPIAFHDALILKDVINANNGKFQLSQGTVGILSPYFGSSSQGELDTAIKANPFLSPYYSPNDAQSSDFKDARGRSNNFLSNLGGVDVTNFANAMSDIMIRHAKEELTASFFNQFRKFVDDHEEFRVLFPQTTGNLQSMLSYKYSEMLPALRAGFFEDLNHLPYKVDDVLLLPEYRDLYIRFPEIKAAIQSLRIVHELESGASNAADVINDFAALSVWKDVKSESFMNMGSGLKTASLFSESLRSNRTDTIWVSPKEIKEFIKDEVAFNVYLGLLYQQWKINTITFYNNGTPIVFSDVVAANKDNIELFQNKVSEFISLADKVQTAMLDIKAKQKAIVTNEDIYNYINLSIDLIDYSFTVANLFDASISSSDYISMARNCNSLYKDIYSKQYNQAVIHAFDIFYELNNIIAKSTAMKTPEADKNNELFDFIEKARPYALFMANIVNAKDEEGIKTALESAILPVGSSSIKKFSKYNLAIQSYLGARYTTGRIQPLASSWNDEFGVSAPIGVGFSYGMRGAGSLTLFCPLIDLGAIVDYKLNTTTNTETGETTVQKDYKIELGQIFSPGAYLVYGLPWNIPLSIGFGGQYGPGLSEISVENNIQAENPYWRWSAFLSVDIPLFNLINTPHNKRMNNHYNERSPKDKK